MQQGQPQNFQISNSRVVLALELLMAEDKGWCAKLDNPVKRQLGDGGVSEGDDTDSGPSEGKKPRREDNPPAPCQTHNSREEEEEGEGEASETPEPRDPGKKQ
jgi:hypothetical protein